MRVVLLEAVSSARARESVQIQFYSEENVTYLSGSCEGFANLPQAFGVPLLLVLSLWTNLTYLGFRTALHLACANGHVDVVTSLVENKWELNLLDGDNRSPLMKAVQCQQEECVAVLLQRGADVNLADADGNTALHLAVLSPNTSVAVLLLEHNASIDAQNKEGFTPLMLAVSLHHVEMVEFLLKEGADVHTRDQCERTPLMTAASGGERNLIKVLLQYGADISHKDMCGRTAADYAVIHGHSSFVPVGVPSLRWLCVLQSWKAAGFMIHAPKVGGPVGTLQGRAALQKDLDKLGKWTVRSVLKFSEGKRQVLHMERNKPFAQGVSAESGLSMRQRAALAAGQVTSVLGATDDFSQGDSIRSSEKEGSDDSWHTSEEEELDFHPEAPQGRSKEEFLKWAIFSLLRAGILGLREPQKPNLVLLMKAFQQFRKNNDGNGSGTESPKSPKKSVKKRTATHGNLNKREYEKEKEDLEGEETRSNDVLEEEQDGKTKRKGEVNQKPEYFGNAECEGEAQRGTGDVCGGDHKIDEELAEKAEEPADTPVSFIAVAAVAHRPLPLARRQEEVGVLRRYHSVTLGMKKPWNNTRFLVCPQQENDCACAPPAEGAEEEEDTESPWDSEVLPVKDMEVSTRDVGRTVPFRVGGRSWVKLRTWVSQQLAFDSSVPLTWSAVALRVYNRDEENDNLLLIDGLSKLWGSKKIIEEECDETQRQLSQEKSARALQEGVWSNHLWRQKELEEETRTIEKNPEESDTEREKAVLLKNQLLQDEIAVLRELDQVRLKHQEEEGKLLEENEALKGKNEDLKKELKRNEEALTQTALQYDGQLNFLRTESAVLTSKLEQTQEGKGRLETEIESFRSRLSSAAQELERLQSSKSDVERTLQRERDEWLRLQDKLQRDLSDVRETNRSLSQQLSEAENKANSLQNELHQLEQVLREKTLLLETTQKELSQAQCQAKECDHARHLEKDQVSQFLIKQESTQERLAQLQSENLLLRQQLEDTQNKGVIKEKVANDVQDWFHDIFSKLRADTEKRVYLVEERNKELNANCADLKERVLKYETDRVEREGMQSMSEASLEVTARYRRGLEEDKLRLQKEAEEVKTKTQAASQDRLEEIRASHHTSLRHQLQHRIRDLECELDSVKNTQEDGVSQKESTPAEAERFRELYVEEVKMRRCLANKLERATERVAEANAKLLQERHRSKSLLTSSVVSGGVAASPVLYSAGLGHLGSSLALNRSLSLAGSFLNSARNAWSSRSRLEAYVAKVQRELDEKITKELEQAQRANIHETRFLWASAVTSPSTYTDCIQH
ncbi:LOW QUALITY PROTEIN: uncharacterized protein O9250_012685 [Rhynochetos jubatus]